MILQIMSSKKKRVFYALYIVFFRLFRNTCQFLLCLFLAIEKKNIYIYIFHLLRIKLYLNTRKVFLTMKGNIKCNANKHRNQGNTGIWEHIRSIYFVIFHFLVYIFFFFYFRTFLVYKTMFMAVFQKQNVGQDYK